MVSGHLRYDGSPVDPGVKVVAFNPGNNRVVGDGTIYDSIGSWRIQSLAQGEVALKVVGPWQFADGSPQSYVWIQPGPDVADPTTGARPGPGGSNGVTPVKTIKNTDALANTGVSVVGLALFGVLLVVAGTAMRRRPALRQNSPRHTLSPTSHVHPQWSVWGWNRAFPRTFAAVA
jgi:hypothetical protein